MNRDEAASRLVACIARFSARGWCDGTAGNFSVTLNRDPLRILITPSGADKGRVSPDELLEIGAEGASSDAARPSAETPLHLTLAGEAGAAAVLHTHSIWGTLLGEHFLSRGGFRLSGYEMLKGLRGVHSHLEEVWVPVIENSQDMAAVAAALRRLLADRPEMRGLVLAGHGLYTWGDSLSEAARHVEIFEFLFRLVGRRLPLAPFDG